ncbi:hypothetical protein [Methanolobus bombayensis]|jgi:hypothetical protein|uniref:hypothetical protein n=1 Tax=Methanolobus bombayensis TaxID=38023 RepID=UPI001AE96BAB|nr:hypothetical protein [Methanolobus bombayensis]MBP1908760.1 hypothetical protein [Methanolobus bombayensis]
MRQKTGDFHKKKSSVDALKSHIKCISIKNLDNTWVKQNKIDLDSLMEDRHYSGDFNKSSRSFWNNNE